MSRTKINTMALLGIGICLGLALSAAVSSVEVRAGAQTAPATPNMQSMAAELEAVKGKVTDQSHVMQDVSYHFSNLWFAGQYQNWELANFYCAETKSHLHWAVRVIPVRKDNAGRDVELLPILQGLENGPLKELQDAIAKHDKSMFETAYRRTMEACYGCHKASDKPFLRPQIPSEPESPIINFDPSATGPL
jgi:hypothetical protein